jgi:hypothetical protein
LCKVENSFFTIQYERDGIGADAEACSEDKRDVCVEAKGIVGVGAKVIVGIGAKGIVGVGVHNSS